ncbi:hypothetical protein ACFSC4_15865 [Deinococcus malanensis]|uniref:hypothetical protein n=1 Tax=Deinococcus malanensis TaxID=1706855 RepID=UPI003630F36F
MKQNSFLVDVTGIDLRKVPFAGLDAMQAGCNHAYGLQHHLAKGAEWGARREGEQVLVREAFDGAAGEGAVSPPVVEHLVGCEHA